MHRDQDQGLHSSLPFRRLVLGLRKLCDVGAGVPQGEERLFRDRDRFIEATGPDNVFSAQVD